MSSARSSAPPQTDLNITNRFVLEYASRLAAGRTEFRVLDFGCGAGELVREGRKDGLDIVGADVFYDTTAERDKQATAGLWGTAIFEIVDGRVPFPDGTFDLVVNNQVMEHVEDLDSVLTEIHRIVKPGGSVLSLFPHLGVIREPHIDVPFVHRFARDSPRRQRYTEIMHRIGLADTNKPAPNSQVWATEQLQWIDTYTHFRSRKVALQAFDRFFENQSREQDYIKFRLKRLPGKQLSGRMLEFPGLTPIAESVFRRLGFLVVLSKRSA